MTGAFRRSPAAPLFDQIWSVSSFSLHFSFRCLPTPSIHHYPVGRKTHRGRGRFLHRASSYLCGPHRQSTERIDNASESRGSSSRVDRGMDTTPQKPEAPTTIPPAQALTEWVRAEWGREVSLARSLGVSVETVRCWMLGRYKPKRAKRDAIERETGIPSEAWEGEPLEKLAPQTLLSRDEMTFLLACLKVVEPNLTGQGVRVAQEIRAKLASIGAELPPPLPSGKPNAVSSA